jgi:cellulose synthase/poly-beta-1,6-N-acetylglucosamine synthase-like glycosyltransferase
MEKIDIKEIIDKVDLLRNEKVTFLITSYKEPKTIGKAIESVLNQKTKREYEIIVCAPDRETLDVAKKYKKVKTFKDAGKGKSFALNQIFSKVDSDILILSDGDVFVNEDAVESILKEFKNPLVGCITGRPIPKEGKTEKWGYWANFLFDAAHKLRKSAYDKNQFLECSGYLFAFRKKIVSKIPLDVAEDTVIPYYSWEKGYSIGYAQDAKVYVKNVNNHKDWLNQKVRCAKAHETLEKYVDTKTTPRVKSFSTEAKGFFDAIFYARSLKQFWWTIELIFMRAILWIKVFKETKFEKKEYSDNWERVESTK